MWHVLSMPTALEIPLKGPRSEPVDFARTIVSHGVAELPPNRIDLQALVLETTLPVPRGARTVRVTAAGGKLRIETVKGSPHRRLAETIVHMFRLDEDLSGCYTLVGEDGDLSWCALGVGRMLRAPTVFEDVVKTICTLIRTFGASCLTHDGASAKDGRGVGAKRLMPNRPVRPSGRSEGRPKAAL
jgi:hypothetical protein